MNIDFTINLNDTTSAPDTDARDAARMMRRELQAHNLTDDERPSEREQARQAARALKRGLRAHNFD